MMVETRLEGAALVLFLSPTGHRDEGGVLPPGRGANALCQLVAAQVRQADVHQQRSAWG